MVAAAITTPAPTPVAENDGKGDAIQYDVAATPNSNHAPVAMSENFKITINDGELLETDEDDDRDAQPTVHRPVKLDLDTSAGTTLGRYSQHPETMTFRFLQC